MLTHEQLSAAFFPRFTHFFTKALRLSGNILLPNSGMKGVAGYTRHFLQNQYEVALATGAHLPDPDRWQHLAAQVIAGMGWGPNQVEDLARLLTLKRIDYGDKNITEFGQIGIIVRTMDKVNRIENLLARDGDTAVGESVQDSLMDIAGYSAVAYLYGSGQWMDDTVPAGGE